MTLTLDIVSQRQTVLISIASCKPTNQPSMTCCGNSACPSQWRRCGIPLLSSHYWMTMECMVTDSLFLMTDSKKTVIQPRCINEICALLSMAKRSSHMHAWHTCECLWCLMVHFNGQRLLSQMGSQWDAPTVPYLTARIHCRITTDVIALQTPSITNSNTSVLLMDATVTIFLLSSNIFLLVFSRHTHVLLGMCCYDYMSCLLIVHPFHSCFVIL